MKLDRLLAKHRHMGRAAALRMIAARRITVNGVPVADGHHAIDRFCRVEVDGHVLQQPVTALYLMLHKPPGYVSVTVDDKHPTVLNLVDLPGKEDLHVAGRLDLSTSGLVLLTNDGRWSKRITEAGGTVSKVYRVWTRDPITQETVDAFARGFYFHTENIMTRPARLELLGDHEARLTLHEGKYHQVKRMFWRVGNQVTALHRESMGGLTLPAELGPGQWRHLTADEVAMFQQ